MPALQEQQSRTRPGRTQGERSEWSTHDDIVRMNFEGVALDALCAESDRVDEGPVAALDVLDPYLRQPVTHRLL